MKQPTKAQLEYWESQLKRYGLTMDAGADRKHTTYGHQIENFGEFEGKIIFETPTGERLEHGEWPISLM